MSDNPEKGEHVDELALLLGHEHGGRLRVVQGDSWYTKKTEIGDLYIFSIGVPTRVHFNNIYTIISRYLPNS
jgi:hypothetical protein